MSVVKRLLQSAAVVVCIVFNVEGQFFELDIGVPLDKDQFRSVDNVAVDGDGNIYIVDSRSSQIKKFSSNGTPLLQWGGPGKENGQFYNPSGIAVDKAGHVYVTDLNHRIQKFTSSGDFEEQLGAGSGNIAFWYPSDLTFDGDGNMYVVDSGNRRILKLPADGSTPTSFGGTGDLDGQFRWPISIALDSDGNIYVVDRDKYSVQKFNGAGVFVLKWGGYGTGVSSFVSPHGIRIDKNNSVYVVDRGNHSVKKFNSIGGEGLAWGALGTGNGQFTSPQGLTVDASGNVIVADAGNTRVQKFSPTRAHIFNILSAALRNGQLRDPRGVAVDASGNIYVTDIYNHKIQKFNSTGVYQTQWGSYGFGDSQFNNPTDIAVDGAGFVYVVDSYNHRIQKFTNSGGSPTKWGAYGSGDGQFYYPSKIAVDKTGQVYVADQYNKRIQKFSSTGGFVGKWGGDVFDSPYDVSIDANNFVYVTDANRRTVQKFKNNGELVRTWQAGEGSFNYPGSIAVNPGGDFFITDGTLVKHLTERGFLGSQWSIANENTATGNSLTIDAAGNLYVVDGYNARVRKFSTLTIHSLSVSSGEPGASVTIKGNFGPTPLDNVVSFNGVPATVTSATPTSLTVTIPATATTGRVAVKRGDFIATNGEEFVILPLTITSFSPTIGVPNVQVSIYGLGFSQIKSENVVKFNGVIAPVVTSASNNITVTLPAGNTAGKITVTTNGITATSKDDFGGTFSIGSFTPANALPGTSVTITGTAFSLVPGENLVFFGTQPATVTSSTPTTLTVTVPEGANTGKIKVQRGTVSVESGNEFVVLPLQISSFSPGIGLAGSLINISGKGFSSIRDNNIVKFNGITALVQAAAPTSLQVVMPAGNVLGKITVTVRGVTATSEDNFEGELTLQSFSPSGGLEGSSISIVGSGFSANTSRQAVAINGLPATITSSTNTTLTVTVPQGATTGKIKIDREGFTVESKTEFVALPLSINYISPGVGAWGTYTTIVGSGFSSVKENNIVKFNGLLAEVSYATPTQLSVKIPQNATDGTVSVTVVDRTVTYPLPFSITRLIIREVQYPELFEVGTPGAEVRVTVNDINEMQWMKFHSIEISNANQTDWKIEEIPFTVNGNVITATISADHFSDPIGLHGAFTFMDKEGHLLPANGGSTYLHYNDNAPNIPNLRNGKTVQAYQMISVPLDLDAPFMDEVFDEMGTYDESKWRLFSYANNNLSEKVGIVEPGRGYWFIMKEPHEINPGPGHTVKVSSTFPFEIELKKGWNFIGNPYNFTISADDIAAFNQIPPNAFRFVQYLNGSTVEQAMLERFKGAFVHVEQDLKIKIPIIKHNGGGGGNPTFTKLDAKSWDVRLSIAEGGFKNELFGFGMNPEADEMLQKDAWDGATFPMLPGMASYSMIFRQLDDVTLCKDVVPTQPNYTWQATLSNDNPVTLSWDNTYFGENEKQLVIEVSDQVALTDMRNARELLIPAGNHTVKFHFGDAAFIQAKTLESEFRLGHVYPNPLKRSSQSLLVSMSLPEGTHDIALSLSDMVGRQIGTFAKTMQGGGRKSLEWKADFSDLSSGVYLVQIQVIDDTGTVICAYQKVMME